VSNLHRPKKNDDGTQFDVTPKSIGWTYLDFNVIKLEKSKNFEHNTRDREVAIVPLSGSGYVEVAEKKIHLQRSDVFKQSPQVVYVPPGHLISITAESSFEFTIGGAPAEGRYPIRIFEPNEMKVEVRGGGAARRQVNHILSHPLPAERLILYEAYVPRGAWSGWPPHCHDGTNGSPYLEETYYFRFDRSDGFGFHRNYKLVAHEGENSDEHFMVQDGDLVVIPWGYHLATASPGHNMWLLNYLAGHPTNDDRAVKPCFDVAHTWIEEDWSKNQMKLPLEMGDIYA